MTLISLLVVAVGLAMDCFTVSLGVGTTGKCCSLRAIFRLALHFGIFQGLMTFLGWAAGSTIAHFISGIDHWVALGLLAFVGVRMIRSGLDRDHALHVDDPSRGRTMVMLSLATSIDALAVGLSLAMLQVDILSSSLVIGGVSLALSLAGLLGGNQLGIRFGKRMEVLGGLLLTGIGVRIVLTHLFAI